MIRIATFEDLPLLLELAEEQLSKSPYNNYEFTPERMAEVLAAFIEAPNQEKIVFVSEDGYLLGGIISPVFSTKKMASELGFYSRNEKDKRDWYKLFKAYEYWAKKCGCTSIQAGSYHDKYSGFLEKSDYTQKETVYQKEL
jgi:hypothetical protein